MSPAAPGHRLRGMVTHIHKRSDNQPRLFLKEWREAKGLTQQQIADRIGTDTGQVSRVETGKRKANQSWVFGYASALGITPEQLYRPPGAPSLDDMVRNAPESLRRQIFVVVEALLKTGTDD